MDKYDVIDIITKIICYAMALGAGFLIGKYHRKRIDETTFRKDNIEDE